MEVLWAFTGVRRQGPFECGCHKIKQQTLESQKHNYTIYYILYIYIYIYIYIQRMMVTANQLHVSASNRPSSGCTFKEKG